MSRKRKARVGETPYRRSLREIIMRLKAGEIKDAKGDPVYTFTPAWLAQGIGRKVTADFRKAMEQFEDENLIEPFDFYTGNGNGVGKAYTVLIQTNFLAGNEPTWGNHD